MSFFLAEGRNIDPEVQLKPYFPPARPSVENLNALCSNGASRPRYPKSCIPPSAHASVRRAGTAVNRVEAWFSQCCQRGVAQGDQQILCCVKQAVSMDIKCILQVLDSNWSIDMVYSQ